ncbi:hypothetical protein AGMMS50212_07460 [Spirochaetia bacterium]|nr:hypothetical protein AGMMS50212_07460 [Spirochaetia bacterium]
MSVDKFTKADIVNSIYQNADLTRSEVKTVVDGVFDVIRQTLMGGRDIEIRGFGTFEVRIRKGRKRARNPRTGEFVNAPPHGIAVFKPGKDIKLEVRQLGEMQLKSLSPDLAAAAVKKPEVTQEKL